MQTPYFIVAIIASISGALIGSQIVRRRYWSIGHYAGQIAMKDLVRRQVSDAVNAKDISIRYRNGFDISGEQLLDYLCYKKEPDPTDQSRGAESYNPR